MNDDSVKASWKAAGDETVVLVVKRIVIVFRSFGKSLDHIPIGTVVSMNGPPSRKCRLLDLAAKCGAVLL